MIFVDTGPLLARYLARDAHHDEAVRLWESLRKGGGRCFTSSFVLDELLTLLGRRADYRFAAERGRVIYSSTALTVLRPAEEDERQALDLFEKYADQEVSFTDCVSFALMRRERIRRAFTFDRHFERAGFVVWPRPDAAPPPRRGGARRAGGSTTR